MKALLYLGRVLLVLVAVAIFPGKAEAKRIPIFFGWGDKISHVRDLPSDVRQQARQELGRDVAVGFKYSRFHIFWLDIWTWGGSHVLYSGDNYSEPTPADWKEILGGEGRESLGKPFLYRFPLGLTILGCVVVVAVLGKTIGSRLFPSEETRVRRLLKDERYRQAVRTYENIVSPPGGLSRIEGSQEGDPQVAFASAVESLRAQGVPAAEAEENLLLILRVSAAGE
jgi:hypothetical protein